MIPKSNIVTDAAGDVDVQQQRPRTDVLQPKRLQGDATSQVTRLVNGSAYLQKCCNELESIVDTIGGCRYDMTEEQLQLAILALQRGLDAQDSLKKVLNRNLNPIKQALAKKYIGREESSRTVKCEPFTHDGKTYHAHSFEVKGKTYFAPPPRTKEPLQYVELFRWLYKEKNNQDYVGDIPDGFRIDDGDLTAICEARLAAGQELPPHVRERSEITVAVRRIPAKE